VLRRVAWGTRDNQETLYAAFVLILVLGLRKGEVLGLTWELVDLDAAELYVGEQVQRVGNELLRRQVKTETSEAPLPLPELCVAALRLRQAQQQTDRTRTAGAWIDTGLVFTTRHGTAVEPRNFSRSFDRCIVKAQVPRITVHGTRKTCGSLLAALDAHARVADTDPAAQQDRGHDGDLYRGSLGRYLRRAPQAQPVAGQLAPLLYFSVVRTAKRPVPKIGTGR
jgi:integrase